VDHSKARAAGGSDHLNNLMPAHVSCNRARQDTPVRTVRKQKGTTRKPLSKREQKAARVENAVAGGISGFLLILAAGGAAGPALVIAGIGSIIAHALDVE